MASLEALALSLSLTAVVLFGVAALAYAFWLKHRRQQHGSPESADFFLTARRSVGAFTIAWAFYAGAMGSWALFAPPSYCLTAGILGLIVYAVASGLPVIIIGLLGGIVHDMVPNVISFADFTNRRFGIGVSLVVGWIMLFNMGIAITAEFTAVGDLFQYNIGVSRIPVVVTIGFVSILYTAVGGLFVSIITDQWQAVSNVVFLLIMIIYVAVTYRQPLGPLPPSLAWDNYWGFAAIAVMPVSLITSTLFSEAMWQRCWATSTRQSLILGSILGGCMVICAVFILGFGGVLAVWGGVWVENDAGDNGNTILFSLFNGETWVLVIVTLLAVTMSESAVDSLQNAIVDTMATMSSSIAKAIAKSDPELGRKFAFMIDLNLWWIRSLVLVLNIVPIIVSLQGYNVLQLFLMANLITAGTAIPIFSGIFRGEVSRIIVTPFSVLFGCASGIASLFWWSAIVAGQQGIPYSEAVSQTFLSAYDWPPFLIAPGASIAGMLAGAGIEYLVRRFVPGWREYPQYSLEIPLGGQISLSTADMLARAHSETAQDPEMKPAQASTLGENAALTGDDSLQKP